MILGLSYAPERVIQEGCLWSGALVGLQDVSSVPKNSCFQGVLTLEYLLRRFVTSETVQNVECDGCARLPSQRSTVTKLRANAEKGDGLIVESVKPKPKTTFVKKLTIGKVRELSFENTCWSQFDKLTNQRSYCNNNIVCLQLPAVLCIHVQRTTWLENGVPLKRFEHIAFPEILHMDPYVYHKRAARPNSLELADSRKGLIGGKTYVHIATLRPRCCDAVRRCIQSYQNSSPSLNFICLIKKKLRFCSHRTITSHALSGVCCEQDLREHNFGTLNAFGCTVL